MTLPVLLLGCSIFMRIAAAESYLDGCKKLARFQYAIACAFLFGAVAISFHGGQP